jgi:guanyl-specific ribonuclease Sa
MESAMRRHLRNPWVWVIAALLCVGWLLWPRTVKSPGPEHAPPPAASAPAGTAQVRSPADEAALAGLPAWLPAEAHDTIARIAHGGPFDNRQDGSTFGNREGHLPSQARGYYREYTVETPGERSRGARRIITGGSPPEVWYYTDDHYDSFRAFTVRGLDVSRAGGIR